MEKNRDLKSTITRAFRWDFIGISIVSLSTFLVALVGVNFLGEAKMGIFAYILTLQGYFVLIIQLGYEPVRIDIMTSLKGLDFSDIWRDRVQGPYGNQTVNFIDRQSFIKSKQISNRTQDKADLEMFFEEKE